MTKYLAIVWKGKKKRQVTVEAHTIIGASDKKVVRALFKKYSIKNGWHRNVQVK